MEKTDQLLDFLKKEAFTGAIKLLESQSLTISDFDDETQKEILHILDSAPPTEAQILKEKLNIAVERDIEKIPEKTDEKPILTGRAENTDISQDQELLTDKFLYYLIKEAYTDARALIENQSISISDLDTEAQEEILQLLDSAPPTEARIIKEKLNLAVAQDIEEVPKKTEKNSILISKGESPDISQGLALLDDLSSFIIETGYEKKHQKSREHMEKQATDQVKESPATRTVSEKKATAEERGFHRRHKV
ncbi:hypothetical protein ACFL35_15970, partial [Candidatus Riflebacteria bacterium]